MESNFSVLPYLIPVLVTILFGVLSWFITNYFAGPLLKVSRLRENVHETLFFCANISQRNPEKPERFDSAYDELRRLAAKLDATAHSIEQHFFGRVAKAYLFFRGIDLKCAATGIAGFSNSLGSVDGSKTVFRHEIEKGLKLPLSDTPERIARIIKRMDG